MANDSSNQPAASATPVVQPLDADRDWRQWSREQFHRIGMWGTLNALDQNQALARARILSHADMGAQLPAASIDAEKLKEILGVTARLPIGSSVTINQPTVVQEKPAAAGDSVTGKLAKAAVLALAAGGLGWGAAQLLAPKQVQEIPGVIEWSVDRGGETTTNTEIGSSINATK